MKRTPDPRRSRGKSFNLDAAIAEMAKRRAESKKKKFGYGAME
jgi:hypothetical protein